MNQQVIQQAKLATSARPRANGMLLRQCACGQRTVAGVGCEACKQKRAGALQRAAIGSASVKGVPPVVHEDLRSSGQSLDAGTRAFMEPRFEHDFSGVRVYSDVRAVQAPGGQTNSFEDCPVDWQRKANAALVRGRPWVANVITGLVNLPDPIPASVATLLNRHFHTAKRDQIREIVKNFNAIYSAMNKSIDFECETECDDNVAAYVYTIWTDLHLCPIWNSLDPGGQANTIIHEIAHDAAGRDDEAYVWQPAYQTLSAEDAIDNADSYSNLAQEAFGP